MLTKNEISRQIDFFENHNENIDGVEALEEEKENKEVVEALGVDKDRLNKIDAILSECIARAANIAFSKLALKTHTVKSAQGKSYSYRRNRIQLWFSEEEIDLFESFFNLIKSTRRLSSRLSR